MTNQEFLNKKLILCYKNQSSLVEFFNKVFGRSDFKVSDFMDNYYYGISGSTMASMSPQYASKEANAGRVTLYNFETIQGSLNVITNPSEPITRPPDPIIPLNLRLANVFIKCDNNGELLKKFFLENGADIGNNIFDSNGYYYGINLNNTNIANNAIAPYTHSYLEQFTNKPHSFKIMDLQTAKAYVNPKTKRVMPINPYLNIFILCITENTNSLHQFFNNTGLLSEPINKLYPGVYYGFNEEGIFTSITRNKIGNYGQYMYVSFKQFLEIQHKLLTDIIQDADFEEARSFPRVMWVKQSNQDDTKYAKHIVVNKISNMYVCLTDSSFKDLELSVVPGKYTTNIYSDAIEEEELIEVSIEEIAIQFDTTPDKIRIKS